MTRMLLTILLTFLIYHFGKEYSNTFFAGWLCCLLADFINLLIKNLEE